MSNHTPKGHSLLFKGEEKHLNWEFFFSYFSTALKSFTLYQNLKFLTYVLTPNIYRVCQPFLSSWQVSIIILSIVGQYQLSKYLCQYHNSQYCWSIPTFPSIFGSTIILSIVVQYLLFSISLGQCHDSWRYWSIPTFLNILSTIINIKSTPVREQWHCCYQIPVPVSELQSNP